MEYIWNSKNYKKSDSKAQQKKTKELQKIWKDLDKTQELIARKYYWLILYYNVKAYVMPFR